DRLEPAPGPPGLTLLNVADRVPPFEVAIVGRVERTAAEADDSGPQFPQCVDRIPPPSADVVVGHERSVVEPELSGTSEPDRQRRVRLGVRRRQLRGESFPLCCRLKLCRGQLGFLAMQRDFYRAV